MTVGQSLKKVRKNFALTQKQMAAGAQLSYRSYQEYEGDRVMPPVTAVMALADAYDVSADYLLGRVPTPDSFVIEELAYSDGILYVHFRNNDWYQYRDVPEDVYKNFVAAPSKGKFFLKNIMPEYACSICTSAPDEAVHYDNPTK
ncbi:MAG: KTSC domain-containing protein [Selenomonadaceae bacterium]|nr:KTSC domain-containing protein [Selenomonadaceae bacterium]